MAASHDTDAQHLQLLSIFHYVVAGFIALIFCIPIFHMAIGIAMIAGGLDNGAAEPPPMALGWFLVLFAGAFILAGWSLAACVVAAGRFLAQRRRYVFCLVTAAILCMIMPFGTVLGVFTIVVLVRPSVKGLFEGQAPAAAAPAD